MGLDGLAQNYWWGDHEKTKPETSGRYEKESPTHQKPIG